MPNLAVTGTISEKGIAREDACLATLLANCLNLTGNDMRTGCYTMFMGTAAPAVATAKSVKAIRLELSISKIFGSWIGGYSRKKART